MSPRPGAVSLPELVLVLTLFAFVLGGLSGFVSGQARVAARQSSQLRLMEAARAARLILGTELRPLAPADLAVRSADSIRIRAFRGGGPVCGAEGARIGVRYRGIRSPEPEKDSVLVVLAGGQEESRALLDSGGGACGGTGVLLTLDAAPMGRPALALIHETGAYHLAGGALRYRRGRSGRQPLVEALLERSTFRTASGAVVFDLAARPDSLPLADRSYRVAAPFLNPPRP